MSHRSRQERARFVEMFHSSGLTRAQFAQQHHINFHTLCLWLADERRKLSSTPSQFVQIQSPAIAANDSVVNIQFGSVTLHTSAPSDYVAALVRALAC